MVAWALLTWLAATPAGLVPLSRSSAQLPRDVRMQRFVFMLAWWLVPSTLAVIFGVLAAGRIEVDAPGEAVVALLFYAMYAVTIGAHRRNAAVLGCPAHRRPACATDRPVVSTPTHTASKPLSFLFPTSRL